MWFFSRSTAAELCVHLKVPGFDTLDGRFCGGNAFFYKVLRLWDLMLEVSAYYCKGNCGNFRKCNCFCVQL